MISLSQTKKQVNFQVLISSSVQIIVLHNHVNLETIYRQLRQSFNIDLWHRHLYENNIKPCHSLDLIIRYK